MTDSQVLPVGEKSQAGEARRLAVGLAQQLGFSETEAGRVAIVAGEMAGNIVKHAGEGYLLLRPLEQAGIGGLEILALDQGPGMASPAESLRDGFSTRGGPGIGLGAVTRLSARFDIHSQPGVGTALLAQLWARPLPADLPIPPLEIGVVSLPKAGQQVNGDDWAAALGPSRCLLVVADGLGYGPEAAKAAQAATRLFRANLHLGPEALLKSLHTGLVATRGAAVAVAEIDLAGRAIHFAGVGNISGAVEAGDRYRGMVSHHGIIGHQLNQVQGFTYPLPRQGLLILHSDGLATPWQLERYHGLAQKHPSLVAGVLYRDYHKAADDVTVLVARIQEAEIP